MPINRNALARYHALDACFANHRRKFFIEDLIDACNIAIREIDPKSKGVGKRQVYDDIRFMKSEQGWSAPLVQEKLGRNVYYRYDDPDFSIKKGVLSQTDLEQLKDAVALMGKLKGAPQFEWMQDMLFKMDNALQNSQSARAIVSFEHNAYLKGLEHFEHLFNAIRFKKTVQLTYQSFRSPQQQQDLVSPYFLKQHNGRWFLFAWNHGKKCLTNYALDRILSQKEVKRSYRENEEFDFEEYFEDVVGVTVPHNAEPVTIRLKVAPELWPYIQSKPIHGSQKVVESSTKQIRIELKLIPNYEFYSHLLSLGSGVEVLAPPEVREEMKKRVKAIAETYK